jgi:thymidylate synthase
MESSEINKTALPPCHDNFQVIGVPLFDNEMIALAGKNGAYFKANETRRVNKKIPEYGFSALGTKKHRYVSCFPFNIASYATLAKIL